MTTTTQAPSNERPRLSETEGFIPFRRGDQMTDEQRAQFQAALNWQPFIRDLKHLSQQAAESAVSV